MNRAPVDSGNNIFRGVAQRMAKRKKILNQEAVEKRTSNPLLYSLRQSVNQLYNIHKMAKLVLFSTACKSTFLVNNS